MNDPVESRQVLIGTDGTFEIFNNQTDEYEGATEVEWERQKCRVYQKK